MIEIIAVVLGASTWAPVWKHHLNNVFALAWRLIFTAVAGVLSGHMSDFEYWLAMVFGMSFGGLGVRFCG